MHRSLAAMLLFDVAAIGVLLVITMLTGDSPGGPGFD
jgi:hypothetical protein